MCIIAFTAPGRACESAGMGRADCRSSAVAGSNSGVGQAGFAPTSPLELEAFRCAADSEVNGADLARVVCRTGKYPYRQCDSNISCFGQRVVAVLL